MIQEAIQVQEVTRVMREVSRARGATTVMKTAVGRTVVPIIRTKIEANPIDQGQVLSVAVRNRSMKRVANRTMERKIPFLRR